MIRPIYLCTDCAACSITLHTCSNCGSHDVHVAGTVSVPLEIIENLVGLIDTPIGRRQYSEDVIEQVQQLRQIIESQIKS